MITIKKDSIGHDTTKNFVFIISSYNQCQFIQKNLESVKMQDYSKDKYRIIYVNDNSNDDSKNIITDFMLENKCINMKLINNEENMGPAYSRYIAYIEALDEEICIFLDGDDWLVEKNTLKMISYVYSKFDIYATFGSMVDEKHQYNKWANFDRKKHNFFPHLRTSYSFLCKKVPINYLKYNEKEWYKFKTDVALFTTIGELCKNKYAFIDYELLYYNRYNAINNPHRGYRCPNKTQEQEKKRELYKDYIANLKELEPII